MYEPDEFYHPDYSHRPLLADAVSGHLPPDHRRTLYWEPEAPLDDTGRLTLTFYNNGKTTRLRVSAAGITSDGKPVFNKP